MLASVAPPAAEQPTPHLTILHQPGAPDSVLRFIDGLKSPGLELAVECREPGVYAFSLEWFIPPALMLYCCKGYCDGFLKEMGKDHYTLLKQGLKSLWSTYFGTEREVPIGVVCSPPGKAAVVPRYSLALSVMAEDGPFRLLLPDDATKSEFEAGIDCFFALVAAVHNGDMEASVVQQMSDSAVYGVIFVVYDPSVQRLRLVDGKSGDPKGAPIES